ncbi:bifunctional homocysteine S-methyltransferase/methylenetetrahydrofolate reductase [Salipaludibacillus keqinensis]|uniref:Bifunctional homocysteine S-methyltransferase/methylenetetrahydrofolate reductase n=1 Tax=Salipaludibacillus keqinensis TaxID=2045207 RepID=A0A323TAG1_9BACI|nr:bifunctional homocysteine S-methyltransferase/methylenetetrahydrofolate reductase [Salipaludibacillus keqinensis]PYZ92030.1 bifunctional homocysteine S-methyltransferase/methylenetetrahydrofolate reductase [Salipaludibacillus keqinensis]
MSFKQEIQEGILIGDGAMGTLLYQKGIDGCFEELNVTDPEQVRRVHKQYIEAGADIIQTNTYAANSLKLSRYHLEDRVQELNTSAVKLAKQAAGDDAYVFATIGGVGSILHKEFDLADIKDSLIEQADVLLKTEVDGFLLETFYDVEELTQMVRYLRSKTTKPIIAQVTLGDIGVLQGGMSLAEALKLLESEGADVVGLNCRMGPYHMLRSLEEVPLLEKATLCVYPNASLPNVRDGRFFYQSNPTYFGDMTESLVSQGVHLIGGCCGTTPEHVKAIREAVDKNNLIPITEKEVKEKGTPSVVVNTPNVQDSLPGFTKKRRSVIVELDPPKALSHAPEFMKGAEALKNAGVDAVTLADNSLASARIDNLSLGSLIKQQVGARPLLHVACRDRNMIGLQSHLLGLHTLGIHDVLAITGDPAKVGDFPGASSVFDMASMDLIRLMKQLNEGISFSGKDLGAKTSFTVAAAFNANARRLDREVMRLEKKVEAGADYFMSQPVYSEERFEEIYEATKHLPVPVYVGIMPLVSSRNAEFLHHEVPGISLTEEVRQTMAKHHGDREASQREGLALARSLADAAMEHFPGIYLITPFLRYGMTVELTKHIITMDKNITAQSSFR